MLIGPAFACADLEQTVRNVVCDFCPSLVIDDHGAAAVPGTGTR